MEALIRPAGYAALAIFAAFAIHNLNGSYIEPTYLGFSGYGDYADLAKLQQASRALPWLFSGLGHLISGFAMVVLTLGVFAMFRDARPATAWLMLAAGILAAAGFLLLGLSHVIGRQVLFLLGDRNPAMRDSLYATATLVRILFNSLAQVSLGAFAVGLSTGGLATGKLPRWFCYYGFLSGAAGLVMGFAYAPVYLFTVLLWSLWLGLYLVRAPSMLTDLRPRSPSGGTT
jgi:hypothetical protein